MKKTLLSLIAAMVLSATPALAIVAIPFTAESADGVIFHYNIYNRDDYGLPPYVELTGAEFPENFDGNLAIAGSVTYDGEEYNVEDIDSKAFSQNTAITSVKFGDGIENIGSMAFFRCTNLESIDFGNTVMNVYESAFMGCTSLTELYVPDRIVGFDRHVFSECSSLKKVRLSPNTEGLSSSLFTKCSSLEDIDLPETIVNYGANCLSYTGLKEITFGPDVYEIGYAALQGCQELEKIVIPNLGNAYIAEDLAKDCPKLKEVIIPHNIVLVNYHAFENCTSLESISLGRDIFTINGCEVTGKTLAPGVYIKLQGTKATKVIVK